MKLAVFDLDGTLVDSAPDIHAPLDRLMAARFLPGFTRQEVIGFIGDGIPALIAKAFRARGREPDATALAEYSAAYAAAPAVETRPFPGIPEALDALAAGGWRMAVCTNKPEGAARDLLVALGLAHRFAAVGGGDSFPVRKPDPGHLRATIEAAGGAAHGAVMIGDHRNDVRAARGAGIPCLFVGWGYGPLAMAEGAPVVTRPAALAADLDALLERLGA